MRVSGSQGGMPNSRLRAISRAAARDDSGQLTIQVEHILEPKGWQLTQPPSQFHLPPSPDEEVVIISHPLREPSNEVVLLAGVIIHLAHLALDHDHLVVLDHKVAVLVALRHLQPRSIVHGLDTRDLSGGLGRAVELGVLEESMGVVVVLLPQGLPLGLEVQAVVVDVVLVGLLVLAVVVRFPVLVGRLASPPPADAPAWEHPGTGYRRYEGRIAHDAGTWLMSLV